MFSKLLRKIYNPVGKIILQGCDETLFTPDIAELEQKPRHHFFVYDEMMVDNRKYDFLKEHSITMAEAFTRDKFHTWKKDLGVASFPIAFETDGFVPDAVRIKGELMLIASSHIPTLDKYKQNGVEFVRKRIRLVIPYVTVEHTGDGPVKKTRHTLVTAWMYVGVKAYWDTVMSGYRYSRLKVHDFPGSPLKQYTCFDESEYVQIINKSSTMP